VERNARLFPAPHHGGDNETNDRVLALVGEEVRSGIRVAELTTKQLSNMLVETALHLRDHRRRVLLHGDPEVAPQQPRP